MGLDFDITVYDDEEAVERADGYYVSSPLSAFDTMECIGRFVRRVSPSGSIDPIKGFLPLVRGRNPITGLQYTERACRPRVHVCTDTGPKDLPILSLGYARGPHYFNQSSLFTARLRSRCVLIRNHVDRTGCSFYGGVETLHIVRTEPTNRWWLPHLNSHDIRGGIAHHPDLGFRSADFALIDYCAKAFATIHTGGVIFPLVQDGFELSFPPDSYQILGLDGLRDRFCVPEELLGKPPRKEVTADGWLQDVHREFGDSALDQVRSVITRARDHKKSVRPEMSESEVRDIVTEVLDEHPSLPLPEILARVITLHPGHVCPARVERVIDSHTIAPNPDLSCIRSSPAAVEHLRAIGSVVTAGVNEGSGRSLLRDLRKEPRIVHMFGAQALKCRSRVTFLMGTQAQWHRIALESRYLEGDFDVVRAPPVVRLSEDVVAVNIATVSPREAHDLVRDSVGAARRVVVFGSGPSGGCPRETTALGLVERFSEVPAQYLSGAPKVPRVALPLELPTRQQPLVKTYAFDPILSVARRGLDQEHGCATSPHLHRRIESFSADDAEITALGRQSIELRRAMTTSSIPPQAHGKHTSHTEDEPASSDTEIGAPELGKGAHVLVIESAQPSARSISLNASAIEKLIAGNIRHHEQLGVVLSMGETGGIRAWAGCGSAGAAPANSVANAAAALESARGHQLGKVFSSSEAIRPGECGAGVTDDGTLYVEAWLPDHWFSNVNGLGTARQVLTTFVQCVAGIREGPDVLATLDPQLRPPHQQGCGDQLYVERAAQPPADILDRCAGFERTAVPDRGITTFIEDQREGASTHHIEIRAAQPKGVLARRTFGENEQLGGNSSAEIFETIIRSTRTGVPVRPISALDPLFEGEIGYGRDDQGRAYVEAWLREDWFRNGEFAKAVQVLHGFIDFVAEVAQLLHAIGSPSKEQAAVDPPSTMVPDM